MHHITYQGKRYAVAQGESVLECLNRHGVDVPSSCRSGICQTCLMVAVKGKPPGAAQKGLKNTLAAQNYFLACICFPDDSMEIAQAEENTRVFESEILSNEPLTPKIHRIRLRRPEHYDYQSGQYLNLYGSGPCDGLIRTYSLASVPQIDDFLEIHVQAVEHGRMSTWLCESAQPATPVKISAALGDCFYIRDPDPKPMLLIGTGSGLAPLYGIVRTALMEGHDAPIWLYHGSRTEAGLYNQAALRELERNHDQFHYKPCLSGEAHQDYHAGRANETALADFSDLKGWRVYLCGHPDMVNATKMKAYLSGASLKDIYADAFQFVKPA